MRHLALLAAASAFAAAASAQIQMVHLAEIDVANAVSGIGNNPGAVAWNGTDLFVAGFNGLGTVQSVALNRLAGALSTTPTWGAPFGIEAATPGQRGYVGLDIHPATGWLVAGYDSGAATANGVACYDPAQVLLWSKSARGSSGVGFDPGYPTGNPALGTGVAWAGFGQPGRALQDFAGVDVWTLATGMGIQVSGQNGNLRDLDFDPATGDIWLRSANNVFRGTRSGDNVCTTAVVYDPADAATINLQNVCFVDHYNGGFVLYNDRPIGAVGQLWPTVIQAMLPNGTPLTLDWGTFAPAAGAGAYDFSYHSATGTLAISDYHLRKVQIFQVVRNPTVAYGAGCPGQGALTPELRGNGLINGVSGGTVTYDLTNAAPLSLALLMLGFDRTQVPFGNGCDILIDPVLPFYLGPVITGPGLPGSGTGSVPMTLPGGYPGLKITAQGVVIENGNTSTIVFSNGVELIIP